MMFADLGMLVIWLALFAAIAAGLWRLGTGPTTLDRMLGFDMITITVVALVLVFSAATGSVDYIEFAFILSGLGFLTTVAYFYYLMQLGPDDDDFDAREQP
ncbi:monovalent cation/H+ antiporter complex subunit F [Sorangium sp. So ce1097]|uniref:monovalent cation/H+ antiporter complex subunit F n=1 Tax=Sorangium sp. So ce1097 TaxID=3133330 RepID=UPI003F6038A4